MLVKLKDLITIKNGADYKHLSSGNVPVIGTGGIMLYVNKALYNKEAILLPRKGSLNNVMYINTPFWTVDTMFYAIPNCSKVDPKYLYYHLSLINFARYDIGSTIPSMTASLYYSLVIDLPPIDMQKKISFVLSLIDNQIDRNNTITKRLQVLAQAIYRRWFLQFNYPNFNKNMLYSNELKTKIPDDWSVLTLGDLVVKIALISNKNNKNTIDLSVMPSSNISLGKLNSCDNFSTNLNKMFEGNILFGSIRPYLKKCGIAPCDGNVVGTIYQFKEVRQNSYNYALITMSQDFFFDYALKVSKGTRMPVVSCDDLLSYKMPYNKKIVDLYSKLPIKRLIVAVNKETNKLSALKEELIPLLINGQLV